MDTAMSKLIIKSMFNSARVSRLVLYCLWVKLPCHPSRLLFQTEFLLANKENAFASGCINLQLRQLPTDFPLWREVSLALCVTVQAVRLLVVLRELVRVVVYAAQGCGLARGLLLLLEHGVNA